MTLAHRVAIMNEGVLQQLGTPRQVYDEPATLFVAGFMGSPPMNFIHGHINENRFESAGIAIPVSGSTSSGKAVLGFRPEAASIVLTGEGVFDAEVFTVEQTGEYCLVTVLLGEETLSIKMPRDFDSGINETVAVKFDVSDAFMFDAVSERRQEISLLL